ncbi:CLUMA_CG017245, isoform A [Clunio marinus]|uniref:CLUMA_CG017245, isoform A n=1 Tax=Clunio marinus TaxID=568069 RepID=A0A1J1IYB4_9DIPT|nr:CLUMA_CG017245, isoform A [Clunio marinus]
MMHSGNVNMALKQNSAVSVYVGIASLILEGRVIGGEEDDDDAFPIKFESTVPVKDEGISESSSSNPSSSRHGVIHRISEKLMSIRQFPGSQEVAETSLTVPTQSRDDFEYERQPRLHHVASAREFTRNSRLTTIPTASASNSSSAASVLHDIDVDWNDISIVFNGIDSLFNHPGSPMKLSTNRHSFHSSLGHQLHQEPSLKIFKNKEKATNANKGITLKPKQGPHCEKFLKKIGIIKIDSSETENEHMCNHVSSFCRRWQFNLRKLLQLLSKGEDSCIEVYLGPENNAILLEQWTIKLTENPTPSMMTIQSLCSAIRSQLYFSQVSSWVELLKKAFNDDGDVNVKDQLPTMFSDEIMQNPRLKKNLQTMQVDLDILFRIKPFDGASCFNDKPNVHNFPDTMVSDRMALRVCLKSLPRLDKIPTLNTEKANLNGFTCDNRIKTTHGVVAPLVSPVASTSCHLLTDRMAYPSCHEKGKHRCKDEDDYDVDVCKEENSTAKNISLSKVATPVTPIFTTTSQTSSSSSASSSSATATSLSHRERQLLKYKKRLMKREKQKKKILDGGDQTSVSSSNASGSDDLENFQDTAINDTFAPLYEAETANKSIKSIDITQSTLKTKLSIATQTEAVHDETAKASSSMSVSSKCNNCGKNLQCWNCDKNQFNFKSPMTSSLSINVDPNNVLGVPMNENKADLLLQAIQRTAEANVNNDYDSDDDYDDDDDKFNVSNRDKTNDNIFSSSNSSHHGDSSSAASPSIVAKDVRSNCDIMNDNNNYLNNNNNNVNNNNNLIDDDDGDKKIVGQFEMENDCRLCKRQKTRHIYTTSSMNPSNVVSVGGSYRRTMSECLVGMNSDDDADETDGAMFCSPRLPMQHNCDDAEFNFSAEDALFMKAYRRAFSEDVINQLPSESSCFDPGNDDDDNDDDDDDNDDCLTIKCNHYKSEKKSPLIVELKDAAVKLTPNVTLQHAPTTMSSPNQKLVIHGRHQQQQQKIPKINLSEVFNSIDYRDDSGIVHDAMEPSPTSDSVFAFNTSPASSYPPTSMRRETSPRISCGDANALLKRRSRHISDRSSISEYSNISDDDDEVLKIASKGGKQQIPPLIVTPSSTLKISSLYRKFVTKTHAAFNKLPLLGSIEESLLRDRIQPKAIVSGFKLLLGASGSFCPTQLTIPAQTFFYEFKGLKHMSTPYVCELRLSRKGYSIPRSGTVQATLLNPQGTVVRMFFVPYDFRDMPAMSQTFIRQRVLAIDEHVSQKEAEQMSTVEQMKHLRYVVHLRFQTGRSGRLCLHTDIKLLISRRTEFDTAQAHAKNSLESPNDLKIVSITPEHPKFSSRIDKN